MRSLAVLVDGAYFTRRYFSLTKQQATARDLLRYVGRLRNSPTISEPTLYRIFYYDCEPLGQTITNPISGVSQNHAVMATSALNIARLKALEQSDNVAVRRGTLSYKGLWSIRQNRLNKTDPATGLSVFASRPLPPGAIAPMINQKGVDMRIGLDMASLAIKRLVQGVVIITGDTDFIPAMKLARTEGLRVYLDTMGKQFSADLMSPHADAVLSVSLPLGASHEPIQGT